MFYIATTRFNKLTWQQNQEYRDKHKIPAIYPIDIKIRHIYPYGAYMCVVEMNNDTNKVEGIGVIANALCHETHNIYSNYTYNTYVYKAKHWISREQIELFDPEIIETLDTILFKGRSHLKRQSGISVLTDTVFKHWPAFSLPILRRKISSLCADYIPT